MANINEYGEIDEMTCPGCSGPIKAEWVACPTCGEGLKASKAEKAKKQKPPLQDKFICPGCGEKAMASKLSRYCPKCNAFVHGTCCIGFTTGQWKCPVCRTIIKDTCI